MTRACHSQGSLGAGSEAGPRHREPVMVNSVLSDPLHCRWSAARLAVGEQLNTVHQRRRVSLGRLRALGKRTCHQAPNGRKRSIRNPKDDSFSHPSVRDNFMETRGLGDVRLDSESDIAA